MASTKEEILGGIEKMTVLELSELVKALEEKFGVSASMPVSAMSASPAGASAAGATAEEKTTFNVMLASAGNQKIQVIKVVREVTGLGLKESKDLVEAAPKSVKDCVSKEEAEKIKAKFEGSGATIEIK